MMDGSPHGATVHFAHTDNPLVLYFETNREYRKTEPLFGREKTRASLVIGSSEGDMKTLQFNGTAELLKVGDMETFNSVYLEKFPEKKEKAESGKLVLFKFTPSWRRFTNWTRPGGKLILTSDKEKGV